MSNTIQPDHNRLAELEAAVLQLRAQIDQSLITLQPYQGDVSPMVSNHYNFSEVSLADRARRMCTYQDKQYSVGSVICMADNKIYVCTSSGWTPRNEDCPDKSSAGSDYSASH